jgi:hypothetical protein
VLEPCGDGLLWRKRDLALNGMRAGDGHLACRGPRCPGCRRGMEDASAPLISCLAVWIILLAYPLLGGSGLLDLHRAPEIRSRWFKICTVDRQSGGPVNIPVRIGNLARLFLIELLWIAHTPSQLINCIKDSQFLRNQPAIRTRGNT